MAIKQLVLGPQDDHMHERGRLIEEAARAREGDEPSGEELFARTELHLVKGMDGPHERLLLDGAPLIEFAAQRWDFQANKLRMFQYYWTFEETQNGNGG